MKSTFEAIGLSKTITDGLERMGIVTPTPIQAQLIPLAMENRDVTGCSATGSGKTLAYILPIFHKIDVTKKEMQVIILAPTHELVVQINRQILLLAENADMPVNSAVVMGQVNIKRQIEKLKEKPQIIVGTAGRVLELIKMRKINAQTVKTIVIDEGDRLLDDNNLSEIAAVIKTTQRDRQLMVFSATLGQDALRTAESFMNTPVHVKSEQNVLAEKILHIAVRAQQRDKVEMLRKIYAALNPDRTLVFLNKNDQIRMVTAKLQHHHIGAGALYGEAVKEERKRAMDDFYAGRISVLIASDIAARGLDISGLSHIVNMDMPPDEEGYTHRAGRTGRAGHSGTVVSIVTETELKSLRLWGMHLGIEIKEKELFKGKLIDPYVAREKSPKVNAASAEKHHKKGERIKSFRRK